MLKKYLLALVLPFVFLSQAQAFIASNGHYEVYAGYFSSQHFIKAQPLKMANLAPLKAYMFGIQSQTSLSTPLISLQSGYTYWHYTFSPKQSVWALAFVPSLHLSLYQGGFVRPIAEISMGPAYVSQKIVGQKDLGSHFVFQQSIGVGLSVGEQHVFNFMARFYHYTNFGIFKRNAEFDIPFVLTAGYQF